MNFDWNYCAQLLTSYDVVAALNVENLKHANSNWNLFETTPKHKTITQSISNVDKWQNPKHFQTKYGDMNENCNAY